MDDEGFFCLPPTLQYFTNFSVHMYLYNNNKDKKKEEEEEIKNFWKLHNPPCIAGSHLKSHLPCRDTKKSLGPGEGRKQHSADKSMGIRPEQRDPRLLPRSAGSWQSRELHTLMLTSLASHVLEKKKEQQDQWFSKAILYRSLVHKPGYKGARQLIRKEEKRDGGKGEGRDAGASTTLPESLTPPSPSPWGPSFDLSA